MKMRKMRTVVAVAMVTVLALTFLAAQLSAQNSAVVPEIGFEIEGNAALDQGGDYDWENVEFPPGVLIPDPNSKATTDFSTFRPDSKFDYPEKWSIEPGQVGPGQNELTNILAWGILPGDLGAGLPEDYWLVLGMERTKKEGTFDLDFEFNQVAWDGSSGGPTRTPGDLAVGFELKGNPINKQTDLQVLIIQYTPGAQPSLCQVTPGVGNVPALVDAGDEPCPPYGDTGWYYRFLADGAIFSESGLGYATMNEEPISVPPLGDPPLWLSTDAQGNPRDTIGPFQFAEAAINLTELGVEASCKTFSTVHAKSRSSLEVTSDLKDLAGPVPLNVNCRLDGHKFLDINGDGFWDQPGEPGLQNWEITLDDGSVTYTDADGYYAFEDLDDGVHTVSEVCPDAWAQTVPGFTDFDTCGMFTHTAELDLYHREVNNLDFGNGYPELTVAKVCPADVFLGDDIEYEITVANSGNVLLKNITVEDPVIDLSETIDLIPGESRTFTGTVNSLAPGGQNGSGPYVVFLPLVMRRAEATPGQNQSARAVLENTATATSQYALATVTSSDSCTTNIHELEVTKDAQTSFTRAYNWTIEKTVDDPGPITLFAGDFATLQYTVTVNLGDPPYVDSDWAVEGIITVTNPAPMNAVLASVTDMLSPDIAATVDCPSLTVPAGNSLTCTYGPVQLPDATNRTNTAVATLINNNGGTTDFGGSASVDFSQASMEQIDEKVQVTDLFWELPPDDLGTVGNDEVPQTFVYTRTIAAPGNICKIFQVPNEATFVANDTGASDSATAIVDVFELCTVSVGYEDLPLALGNDWDYNDLVIDIVPYLEVSAQHDLLATTYTIQQAPGAGPPAHLTGFTHAFHLQPYADAFTCDGTYTLRVTTGGIPVTVTGTYQRGDDFLLIPDTAAPPDLVELRIDFDVPPATGCPFDFGNFDPVNQYHGEWLFFDPWIWVRNTDEPIHVNRSMGQAEPRILTVPVDWQWPVPDGNHVWNEYPCVAEGDPILGPIFQPYWWDSSRCTPVP